MSNLIFNIRFFAWHLKIVKPFILQISKNKHYPEFKSTVPKIQILQIGNKYY